MANNEPDEWGLLSVADIIDGTLVPLKKKAYEFSSTINEVVFPVYCGSSSYIARSFAKQLARTLKAEGDARYGSAEELFHNRSRRIHHSLITSKQIRQRLMTTTECLTSSVSQVKTQSTSIEIVSLLCSFLKRENYDEYADIFLNSMERVNWREAGATSCLEVLKAFHQYIDDVKCTKSKQASLGCWKMTLALYSGKLSAIVRCLLLPQSFENLEQRYKPPTPQLAIDVVDLSIDSFFIRNYQFPFRIDSTKVTCIPEKITLSVFCGNSLSQLESLGMMGTRLQKKVEHVFSLRKGESLLSITEEKAVVARLSRSEDRRFLQEFREILIKTGVELRKGSVIIDCCSVETRNIHLTFTVFEGEIICLVSCITPNPSKRKLFVLPHIPLERIFATRTNDYEVELSSNNVLLRDPVDSKQKNGLHFTKGTSILVGRVGLKVNFSPFCVELWVYPRNATEAQTILSVGKRRVLEIVLEIEPHEDGVEWRGGSRTPHLNASFTSYVTPGKLALCERWWHVALNFTGTLWELWLNDHFVSRSPALISPEPIRDVPIELGKSYVGFLSEVRIWNVARTATELYRDAHRRLLGSESGLVSYYPLNEGFGDVLTDYSSSAEHALLHYQAANWFPIPYFPVSEREEKNEKRFIHDFIPVALYENSGSTLFFSVTPNYYTVVSNCAGWKQQESSGVTIFQYSKESRSLVSQMRIDLTARYRLKGIAYNPMKGSLLCWAGAKEGNPNQLTIWDVHNQSILPLSGCRSFESIWMCGKDVFSHAANYAQKFINAERYLADQSSWIATLPDFTVDFSEELIPLLVVFAKTALEKEDKELAQDACLLLHVNLFFRYEINVAKLHKEVGPPFNSVAELMERLASLDIKTQNGDDYLHVVAPKGISGKPILEAPNKNKNSTTAALSGEPSCIPSCYPQRDDIIRIAFMPFCLKTQLLRMCCQCFLPTKIQIQFLHTHAGRARSELEEPLFLSLLDLYSTLQACSELLNDTEAAQIMYCALIREATSQVDRCLTNNGTMILQRTSRCLEVFQEVLFAKVTDTEENRSTPARSASRSAPTASSITNLCIHYTKTLLRTCRKTVEAVLKVIRKSPEAEQPLMDSLECSHVGSLLPSFSLSLPLLPTVVLASCPTPVQSCRETLSALLSTITTGKVKWISDLGIALTFSLSLIGCSLLQAEPEEERDSGASTVEGSSYPIAPEPEYVNLLRGGKRKKGSERDAIIKNLQQGVGGISKVFEELQKKDQSALRVVRDESLKRMERNVMAAFCALLLPTKALKEATPESLKPAFRLVLQMRPWVLSKRQESKEYVSQVEARAVFLSQFESCCKGEAGGNEGITGASGAQVSTSPVSVVQRGLTRDDDAIQGGCPNERVNNTMTGVSGSLSNAQSPQQKWRRFFLHWRAMRIQKTLISSQEETDETGILRAIINFLQSDVDPSTGPERLVARRTKKAQYRLSGLLLVKQLTEEARVSPGLASIVLPVFGKALSDWHYADGVDCCSSEYLFRLHGAYFQLFNAVLEKYLCETEFLRQPWAILLISFFTADMRPLDFRHMRPEISSAFRALWATITPPICTPQDQHFDHTTIPLASFSAFSRRQRNRTGAWRPRRFNNGVMTSSIRETKLTPEMTAQSMTIGESGLTVKSSSGGGRGSCVAPCTWQSSCKDQTYYYELHVVDLLPGASCSIGVGPRDYSLTRLPGWDPSSYALHSDAGVWFVHGRLGGFSFGMGDIIGCGWNVEANEIYWTKNGSFLVSTASRHEEELHPLIGFEGAGMAKVNFGEEPFVYVPQLGSQYHGATGSSAGNSASLSHSSSLPSPPTSRLQPHQQLIGQDAWDTFRIFSLRAVVCLQRCTLLLSGVSQTSIRQLSSCVQYCFNALSQELMESLYESPGYAFCEEKVQSLLSHTATVAQLLNRVPKSITAACVSSLVSTLRNASRIIFSSPGASGNVAIGLLTCWFQCMHLYPPASTASPLDILERRESSPEPNLGDPFGFLETLIRLAGRLFFIPGSQDSYLYFQVAQVLRPRMEEISSVALALLQRINYTDIFSSQGGMDSGTKGGRGNGLEMHSPSFSSFIPPSLPLKNPTDTAEVVESSIRVVHSWRPALHEWIIRTLSPVKNQGTSYSASTTAASTVSGEREGVGSTEKMVALAILGGGPRHAVPGDTISVYTSSHCITTGTLLSYSLAEELVEIVVTEESDGRRGRQEGGDLVGPHGASGTVPHDPDSSSVSEYSGVAPESARERRRICKTVPLRVCGLILPDDETHYFPSVGCTTHKHQAEAVLALAIQELEQLLMSLTGNEANQEGDEGLAPAPPTSSPIKSTKSRHGRHSGLTGAYLRATMQSSATSCIPPLGPPSIPIVPTASSNPPFSFPSHARRATKMTVVSSLFYAAQQLSSILWRCVTRGVVQIPKPFLETLYRLSSVFSSLSSSPQGLNSVSQHAFDVRELRAEKVMTDWLCGAALQTVYDKELSSVDNEQVNNRSVGLATNEMGTKGGGIALGDDGTKGNLPARMSDARDAPQGSLLSASLSANLAGLAGTTGAVMNVNNRFRTTPTLPHLEEESRHSTEEGGTEGARRGLDAPLLFSFPRRVPDLQPQSQEDQLGSRARSDARVTSASRTRSGRAIHWNGVGGGISYPPDAEGGQTLPSPPNPRRTAFLLLDHSAELDAESEEIFLRGGGLDDAVTDGRVDEDDDDDDDGTDSVRGDEDEEDEDEEDSSNSEGLDMVYGTEPVELEEFFRLEEEDDGPFAHGEEEQDDIVHFSSGLHVPPHPVVPLENDRPSSTNISDTIHIECGGLRLSSPREIGTKYTIDFYLSPLRVLPRQYIFHQPLDFTSMEPNRSLHFVAFVQDNRFECGVMESSRGGPNPTEAVVEQWMCSATLPPSRMNLSLSPFDDPSRLHHITVVQSNCTISLYVEGMLQTSKKMPVAVSPLQRDFFVGGTGPQLQNDMSNDNGAAIPFIGEIKSFRLYEIALEPSMVEQLSSQLFHSASLLTFLDDQLSIYLQVKNRRFVNGTSSAVATALSLDVLPFGNVGFLLERNPLLTDQERMCAVHEGQQWCAKELDFSAEGEHKDLYVVGNLYATSRICHTGLIRQRKEGLSASVLLQSRGKLCRLLTEYYVVSILSEVLAHHCGEAVELSLDSRDAKVFSLSDESYRSASPSFFFPCSASTDPLHYHHYHYNRQHSSASTTTLQNTVVSNTPRDSPSPLLPPSILSEPVNLMEVSSLNTKGIHRVLTYAILSGSDYLFHCLERTMLQLSQVTVQASMRSANNQTTITSPTLAIFSLIPSLLEHLLGLANRKHLTRVYESTHPFRVTAAATRSPHAVMMALHQRYYQLYFDSRCSSSDTFFTFAVDQGMTNELIQIPGFALTPFAVPLSRMFFHVRADSNEHQWGYKVYVVYNCRPQLLAMRLFRIMLTALFYNSTEAGFRTRPYYDSSSWSGGRCCSSNEDYHFYFLSNTSSSGSPCSPSSCREGRRGVGSGGFESLLAPCASSSSPPWYVSFLFSRDCLRQLGEIAKTQIGKTRRLALACLSDLLSRVGYFSIPPPHFSWLNEIRRLTERKYMAYATHQEVAHSRFFQVMSECYLFYRDAQHCWTVLQDRNENSDGGLLGDYGKELKALSLRSTSTENRKGEDCKKEDDKEKGSQSGGKTLLCRLQERLLPEEKKNGISKCSATLHTTSSHCREVVEGRGDYTEGSLLQNPREEFLALRQEQKAIYAERDGGGDEKRVKVYKLDFPHFLQVEWTSEQMCVGRSGTAGGGSLVAGTPLRRGKWYFELRVGGPGDIYIGVLPSTACTHTSPAKGTTIPTPMTSPGTTTTHGNITRTPVSFEEHAGYDADERGRGVRSEEGITNREPTGVSSAPPFLSLITSSNTGIVAGSSHHFFSFGEVPPGEGGGSPASFPSSSPTSSPLHYPGHHTSNGSSQCSSSRSSSCCSANSSCSHGCNTEGEREYYHHSKSLKHLTAHMLSPIAYNGRGMRYQKRKGRSENGGGGSSNSVSSSSFHNSRWIPTSTNKENRRGSKEPPTRSQSSSSSHEISSPSRRSFDGSTRSPSAAISVADDGKGEKQGKVNDQEKDNHPVCTSPSSWEGRPRNEKKKAQHSHLRHRRRSEEHGVRRPSSSSADSGARSDTAGRPQPSLILSSVLPQCKDLSRQSAWQYKDYLGVVIDVDSRTCTIWVNGEESLIKFSFSNEAVAAAEEMHKKEDNGLHRSKNESHDPPQRKGRLEEQKLREEKDGETEGKEIAGGPFSSFRASTTHPGTGANEERTVGHRSTSKTNGERKTSIDVEETEERYDTQSMAKNGKSEKGASGPKNRKPMEGRGKIANTNEPARRRRERNDANGRKERDDKNDKVEEKSEVKEEEKHCKRLSGGEKRMSAKGLRDEGRGSFSASEKESNETNKKSKKRSKEKHNEEGNQEGGESHTEDLVFYPFFALNSGEVFFFNFGGSHFEFEPPRFTLPLDPVNFAFGTLIPYNHMRAFQDLASHLLTSPDTHQNRITANIATTSTLLLSLPSFFSSPFHPMPPFCYDEPDPFSGSPDRAGPAHVSLLAVEGTEVNGLEVKNVGIQFATIVADCAVSGGCWYYEVTLRSQGLMQIGWGRHKSLFDTDDSHSPEIPNSSANRVLGIGDKPFSWSIDLFRQLKWCNGKAEPLVVPRRWNTGDVIGCAIDLNNRELHFYFNGRRITSGGGAPTFRNLPAGMFFSPGISFRAGNYVTFNFGSSSFQYKPEGFQALGVPDTWCERMDTYYANEKPMATLRRLSVLRALWQEKVVFSQTKENEVEHQPRGGTTQEREGPSHLETKVDGGPHPFSFHFSSTRIHRLFSDILRPSRNIVAAVDDFFLETGKNHSQLTPGLLQHHLEKTLRPGVGGVGWPASWKEGGRSGTPTTTTMSAFLTHQIPLSGPTTIATVSIAGQNATQMGINEQESGNPSSTAERIPPIASPSCAPAVVGISPTSVEAGFSVNPGLNTLPSATMITSSTSIGINSALWERFRLLSALARVALVVVPFLSLETYPFTTTTTRLFLLIRTVFFRSVRMNLINTMLVDTTVRLELLRLSVNRRLALDHKGNPKNTLFGQILRLLADRHPRMFQTNKRIWSTVFLGEGADDVGGPYRELLNGICQELMSSVLPFFVPTANHVHNTGTYREAFVPAASATSPYDVAAFTLVGRLMGSAIRGEEPLSLYFPPLVWKYMCRYPITEDDLGDIDVFCVQCIEEFRRAFTEYEQGKVKQSTDENGRPASHMERDGKIPGEGFGEALNDATFVTRLSDHSLQELIPGGAQIRVTPDRCGFYVERLLETRLHEYDFQLHLIREGLLSAVPEVVLLLFTPEELEEKVCGKADYAVEELRKGTIYDGITADDRRVQFLWKALEEATPQQRRLFLRFVSGRDRLPVRLRVLALSTTGSQDDKLPQAATCFFAIELPDYSSLEVMKQRLYYSIENCRDMDKDFYTLLADDLEAPRLLVQQDEGQDEGV